MADAHSTVTYKDIPGFPGYRVGDDGSVWSCKKGKYGLCNSWKKLCPSPGHGGYLTVTLNRKAFRIHTVILRAFVGPCPEGMECRHLDGNPVNNCLSNLVWGTHRENLHDRKRHDTDNKGERNGQCKLTRADILAIRAAYAQGGITQVQLARKYGLHKNTVYFIVSKKRWGHY